MFPHANPGSHRQPLPRSLSCLLPVLSLAILLAPQTLLAQIGGGSSSPSPTGGRPQTTRAGFMDVVQSGGEWAVEKLKSIGPVDENADSPKWDSIQSPQHAVLTFVAAMDEVALGKDDAWPRALQTLAADDTPETRKAALRLQDVFDRLPTLTPSSIPADETVSGQGVSRWELFPRGIDSNWAYEALGDSPAGAIVLEKTDAGWQFNEPTIEGAKSLAESMRAIPPRSRWEDKGGLFRQTVGPTFTQTSWWGWPTFLLALAGGVAGAWGASWLINNAAGKLNDKGDEIVAPLLRGIIVPVSVLCFTVGYLVATAALHLEPSLERSRWNLARFLVLIAGAWLLVSLFELILYGVRRLVVSGKDPYARMSTTIIRRLVRLFAIGVLLIYVFQHVLEWNVTAVIGGIGLVGLALSLAAKDAIGNLFGAFMIFASRPFLVGDWIIFKGAIGEVDDVSLQMTKIRLLGGELLAIPNKQFVDQPVENLSQRKWKRRVMNIQITYDTPVEKVKQAMAILDDILRSEAVVGEGQGDPSEHPPKIAFDSFGAHYLNLRADYWYLMSPPGEADIQRDTDRGYLTYLAHCSTVNQLVLERFNDAGIDFAFPTQTIVLEGDEEAPVAIANGEK